jgi:hypothetical protein
MWSQAWEVMGRATIPSHIWEHQNPSSPQAGCQRQQHLLYFLAAVPFLLGTQQSHW